MKKAVIFAPFWRQKGHVGNYRVDRFIRWLAADGYSVVIVRAGSSTRQRPVSWGVELTVRDPLGLYRSTASDSGSPVKTRKRNKLRRFLAYWLFNPDPGIVWARAAARHPMVWEKSAGTSFVLSSNPPESAHLGAAALAKKMKAKLIIDMRDGWLDEPLKQLLRDSKFRRWREGKLEYSILQQADKILVTSLVWKSLLYDRLPFTQDKTVVLTNGYSVEDVLHPGQARKRSINEPLRLIHAGRFTGSSLSRKVSYLLEPLLLGAKRTDIHCIITLLGNLELVDYEEIKQWQPQFNSKGWTIEIKDAVSRDEMMVLLQQADGLLLLSVSHAAIPSKLFEYLPLMKPIFAATPQLSAVREVGLLSKQLFFTDYRQPDELDARLFISACKATTNSYGIPADFSEKELSKIFIGNVVKHVRK